MDEKVNFNVKIRCNLCNKSYSSKSSLCNHNKKFHSINEIKNSDNILKSSDNILKNSDNILNNVQSKKIYKCRICNNIFNNIKTRWSHEQKCKTKSNQDTLKEKELELELQIKKEEAKIKKEEADILRLKLKLQNSDKIENITLRKLNKLLKVHNTRIKNSTVNSHNNIQNNNYITNNFQLIGFGKEEDLQQILTNKEKKMIVNAKFCALDKLIEIVHCGKYNQFKNIILTNMKDNYIYKYDLHPIEIA
jgi:hypothetical protein